MIQVRHKQRGNLNGDTDDEFFLLRQASGDRLLHQEFLETDGDMRFFHHMWKRFLQAASKSSPFGALQVLSRGAAAQIELDQAEWLDFGHFGHFGPGNFIQ